MSSMETRQPEPEKPENDSSTGREEDGGSAVEDEAVEEDALDVMVETARQRESTAERIAEAVWTKPVRFVEHVISHRVVPQFRRFVERFSDLDDETLSTDELQQAREKAKDALDDQDRAA